MGQPTFLMQPSWATLADIAALAKAELGNAGRSGQRVRDVAAIDLAGPMHVTFFEHRKYESRLARTHAGACLVSPELESKVPPHVAVLRVSDPYRAFVNVARELHRDSLRPGSAFDQAGIAPSAVIHPSAWLEDGVTVDPLATIGPNAEIGAGTTIGAGVVIGPSVTIGRDCSIAAGTSIFFAMIGNGVIVHPGCRIGQDGFGFTPGPKGHTKIPQIGRVIIQNDVEIGANTTIDRGGLRDTVIGEGSKIDNLVQIAHNVAMGRHCIVVGQCGIAGSATLGDGVVLGARAGIRDHVAIGDGAQIASRSSVYHDVPAGGRYGGAPAKPMKQFLREVFAVERLGRESGRSSKSRGGKPDSEGQG